ncbi:MAG: hypothetical protein ACM3UX_00880, partial [Candidatus Woesearchaeota archaeon]
TLFTGLPVKGVMEVLTKQKPAVCDPAWAATIPAWPFGVALENVGSSYRGQPVLALEGMLLESEGLR